nr:YpmS family protein [Lentibacillus saliphilus]
MLFFILLISNGIVLLTLSVLLFWPAADVDRPDHKPIEKEDSSEFIVRTTKQNVDDLANAYLEELLKGTKHHYSITLGEDVQLNGELPVFSTTVPLTVRFDPIVQANGDVVLKQKSISVGLLQLPNQKIMEYMKKYLPMPDWVTVDAKNEEIYVAVTNMDIKSNFHVYVEQLDLESNNLAFKIRVPYETLGID